MKTINKLGLLLCSALTLVACESETYKGGEWDAADGYQNVQFVKASQTDELDPTEPTTATVTMKRENTKGALDVKADVVKNDGGVFTVSDFHFADGEELGTATISFPNAEIGTSYALQLTVTDKNLVSSYSDKVIFNYSVTRVKWVSLGNGTFIDNTLPEFYGTIWNLQGAPEFFIRDDDHNKFRVRAPHLSCTFSYDGGTLPFVGGFIDEEDAEGVSEWLTFEILQKGDSYADVEDIQSEDLVAFSRYFTAVVPNDSYGELSYCHPSIFSSLQDEAEWQDSKVMSWQDAPAGIEGFEAGEKIPAEIDLGPMLYAANKGGYDFRDAPLVLYFPGYKPAHVADLEEDFEWEEVFTGEYISEQLGTKGSAALYKGTCTNTTDDCDKTFESEYGTAYTIAAPYAEDYNLLFTVKDGNIMIPEGYEYQATGLQALNQDVYAKVNIGHSTFTEKLITLNITFTNEDGSVVFGTADEQLSNITYTTVGTADWAYYFSLFANEDGSPYLDAGLELQQRDDDETQYQILHALYDVTIQFSIDEDNNVRIPQQFTGVTYGADRVYVGDIPTLMGEQFRPKYPSVYDPETKTITSSLGWPIGEDLYVSKDIVKLNFGTAPASVKKAAKKQMPEVKVLRGMSKKFNVKSPWSHYTKQAPQRVTKNSAPQYFLNK